MRPVKHACADARYGSEPRNAGAVASMRGGEQNEGIPTAARKNRGSTARRFAPPKFRVTRSALHLLETERPSAEPAAPRIQQRIRTRLSATSQASARIAPASVARAWLEALTGRPPYRAAAAALQ